MRYFIALILLVPALYAETIVPPSLINTNTSWDLAGSPYIVQGDVFVYGNAIPVLTIEPGVEVRFQVGASLEIAYLSGEHDSYRGGLVVQGTAGDPVLFTADNGFSGGWEGVRFNNSSDYNGANSSITYCTVEKAVQCVTVNNSNQPVMQDVELAESTEWPLHLAGADLINLNNVILSDNTESRVLYSGTITDSYTFDIANWPLDLVFSNTQVYSSNHPLLTLTPGSELRFLSGSTLDIGRNHSSESSNYLGSLFAQGTAGDPIVFTADDNSVGGWNGLRFNNSSDYGGATSLMEHCVVEKGVRCITVSETSTPTLQEVELNESSEWPLYLDACDLIPTSNVSATGNPDNRACYTGLIRADRSIDEASWTSLEVVFGNVTIYSANNPTLTVLAGSELRFLPGSLLDVAYLSSVHNNYRGGLVVQGTAGDPVLFTADNGLAGGWEGIRFNDASDYNGAYSSIAHCTVEKAVRCITSRTTTVPSLQEVALNESSDWPLYMDGSSLLPASGLTASGNLQDRALYTGNLTESATFDIANWPLDLVFSNAQVYGSSHPVLTLTPGSELRFLPGTTLDIARNHSSESTSYLGSLIAQGTAGDPILFTADDNSVGGWEGIRFNNSSDYGGATSLMEYCVVEKGVRCITVSETSTPTLQEVELNESSEWPLYLDACDLIPTSNVSATGNPDNRACYTGLIRADRSIDEASWTSLEVVFGNVTIYSANNPTLTVLAGSELRFLPGSLLDVAYLTSEHNSYRGGLVVQGAAGDSVLFTSDNGLAGGWEGIRFNNSSDYNSANSSITHCVVEKAVRCITARTTTVPTLENVALNESTDWPLYMDGSSLLPASGLTASGNVEDRALYTGNLTESATFDIANWPLDLVFSNTQVYGSAHPVLTLTPGSELRFLPGTTLDIARNHSSESTSYLGSLIAQGTAVDPILFTADDNNIGGWTGIRFNNSSDYGGATSLMEHCVVEKGVRCITVSETSTPTLQEVELNESSEWPLYLDACDLIPTSNVSATGNPDNRACYTGLIRADRSIDEASWTSLEVVFGNVTIYSANNPTLTVLAGSELRFLPGSLLDVAYLTSEHNSYRGGLVVQGAAGDSVLFTSDNGLAGGWEGIRFNNSSDYNGANSSITHCVVEKAVRCITSQTTSVPSLQEVALNESSDWPLYMDGSSLLPASGLTASGNVEDRALYTGNLTESATFDIANWPLDLVFSNTQVYGGAHPVLTLTPGSELRFLPGTTLDIARNHSSESTSYLGSLIAQGTAGDPILFTADNDSSGGWTGIRFNNSSDYADSSSILQHCVVSRAVHGIEMQSTRTPSLEDSELNECSVWPLLLTGSDLPLVSNVSLNGNTENRALFTGVVSESYTFDLVNWPLELVFSDLAIYGPGNPVLTLTPGSELRFLPEGVVHVAYITSQHDSYRGGLQAVGTPEAPIVFTADNDLAGSWDGVRFNNSSDHNGAASRFQHCVVNNAVVNLALYDTMEPDTLLDCTLQYGTDIGLVCQNATPLVANCRLYDNTTGVWLDNGDLMTVGDDPDLSNAFLGNSIWNLYNNGSGDVAARYNAWCSPQGYTPAEMIYDQIDDPAKGLVSYLPVVEGELLRVSIRYIAETETIHLEWCPLLGASDYQVHGSAQGWFEPDESTLITTTTDSWLDFPRVSLPDHMNFRIRAEMAELRSSSSCGEGRLYDSEGQLLPPRTGHLKMDGRLD